MICWICNNEPATTGEHRSKRSDIIDQLGNNGPFYFHDEQRRNLTLQSANASRLKFSKSLCNSCNSARTQPYDLAWQRLSSVLRGRQPPLKTGDVIRASRVFPAGASAAAMLNMHFFFVKLLGCQIIEANLPIDPPIDTFSQALMNGTPHPNIWLAFSIVARSADWVGASNLGAAAFGFGTKNHYVCQFYEVGQLSVRVRLSSAKLKDDWHPSSRNRIVIANLIG
jgi:hypothetical protein